MKKILFSILCAFMACSMASAQYLNVKMDDGTWRSFKTSTKTEVDFGAKKGTEPTESAQTVTVNGHTVAVKLADDTPASEVMLGIYAEDEKVKIKAASAEGYGLWCSMDDNGEEPVPNVSNGFYTFTLSDISKDMVVTVGYITVSFDLNNSGMDANFSAKPDDKKVEYNTTINEPAKPFSDKYGFRGWYKDKACTEAWNFSTGVTKSMTLYAKWVADPTGTKINEHEFVKLGGYYWATENVYKAYGVAFHKEGDKNYGSYYVQRESRNAATSWGGTWVLPSGAQWQALIDYCDWEWKTDYVYNGKVMNGMLVTGREGNYESGHKIFLPAAGYFIDGHPGVDSQGTRGCYWSTDYEMSLNFYDGDHGMRRGSPDYGLTVRLVSE